MFPFNLVLYLRLIATVLLVWEMGSEALGLPIEMLAAIPASLSGICLPLVVLHIQRAML